MSDATSVRAIQTWYPQIYLACHLDHKRASTSRSGISPRDSSILAHLDETAAMTPAALARHLGIGAPSMSAALKRLTALGYVAHDRDPIDRRRLRLRLTPAGAAAMADSSVLETDRVRAMLRRLTPDQRRRALEGLELLAGAARSLMTRTRAR